MVMINMQGIDKVSTGISNRIEPGIYDVQVIRVDDGIALKGGQSGQGSRFHFKVANEGAMHGREIQHLLNVGSTSADNLKYSLQEFAGMAVASGVPQQQVLGGMVDTQAMTGRQLSIVVGPQKTNPQYVEVKAYMPAGARNDPTNYEKVKALLAEPPATNHGPSGDGNGGWGNTGIPPQGNFQQPQGNQQPQPGNQPQGGQNGNFSAPAPQNNNGSGTAPAGGQQPQPTWGGNSGGFSGPS